MAKHRFVCSNCGFIGKPMSYIKGNFVIELFLWLLFLIPGVIYSLWRLSTRYKGCPKCKTSNMIPEDTPKGQEFMARSAAYVQPKG